MNPLPRLYAVAAISLAFSGVAAAQSPPVAANPASTPAGTPRAPARPQSDLRAEPVPPAVDAAFRASDTNHDGALSLSEFRNGWRRLNQGSRRTAGAGLRQQFDRIDANDNGGIDRTEYPNLVLVKRAGTKAPPFSQIDGNRDQKLDFAEYSGLVRRLSTAQAGDASPDQ